MRAKNSDTAGAAGRPPDIDRVLDILDELWGN